MTSNKTGRVGQVLFGGTLLAIAVAAGATGMKMNIQHGLELRPEAGILFGLADLTKIVLPIVCGLIGWTLQTRLVAVVCVMTSLFCVATGFYSSAERDLTGKQHGADQYTMAKADVAKIEARVASLDASVAKEAANKGCGNVCKAFKSEASSARSELLVAKAKLEAAKPVAVNGNEAVMAKITAGLFLVLIEALIWMAVPAMTLISQAMASKPKNKSRKAKKVAKKPARKDWTKPAAYVKDTRLTRAGKIDRRTKAGRAVKRVMA